MVLATVDAACRPSARVVLCKRLDQAGYVVFFTNYESRKGANCSARLAQRQSFIGTHCIDRFVSKGLSCARPPSRAMSTSQAAHSRIASVHGQAGKANRWLLAPHSPTKWTRLQNDSV